MGRTLIAREVAQILGVSSKTVREWANDGVLKGEKTDKGPGKETWEFREDDIYSCADKRVVNRLKPQDVQNRRNASQRIEDLEREVEHLKTSLQQTEEALQSEREGREGILAEKELLHEQKVAELEKTVNQCEGACFAAEGAIRAAIRAIDSNRGLEKLFSGKKIKLKYRMDEDLESWHLRYTLQRGKAHYEMREFKFLPAGRYEALNRYLLKNEAGEFRGCRNPTSERLKARRVLYGLRLRFLAIPPLLFLLLLMALGKVTLIPALVLIALGVAALVVVDSIYRVRIWLRKRGDEKERAHRRPH